jgi:hypothetical protein
MRRRGIGVLICVILLACLVSPFVETAVHSDGSILDGRDNESTVHACAVHCTRAGGGISCSDLLHWNPL